MPLRIVHADRSALFHNGMKRVFADNPDFDLVDHCGYLEQALESFLWPQKACTAVLVIVRYISALIYF